MIYEKLILMSRRSNDVEHEFVGLQDHEIQDDLLIHSFARSHEAFWSICISTSTGGCHSLPEELFTANYSIRHAWAATESWEIRSKLPEGRFHRTCNASKHRLPFQGKRKCHGKRSVLSCLRSTRVAAANSKLYWKNSKNAHFFFFCRLLVHAFVRFKEDARSDE